MGRLETGLVKGDKWCDRMIHQSFAGVEGLHLERSIG
jgi:hypothetical protein